MVVLGQCEDPTVGPQAAERVSRDQGEPADLRQIKMNDLTSTTLEREETMRMKKGVAKNAN
jgi:hypothetical protein